MPVNGNDRGLAGDTCQNDFAALRDVLGINSDLHVEDGTVIFQVHQQERQAGKPGVGRPVPVQDWGGELSPLDVLAACTVTSSLK